MTIVCSKSGRFWTQLIDLHGGLQPPRDLCDKSQGCAETCIFSPAQLVVLLLFADGVGVNYLNISWARYLSLGRVQPTSERLCLCAVLRVFLAFSKVGTRTASVILPFLRRSS
jgi:hypothetical protein